MATSRLKLIPGQAYLYDGTEGVYQVISGQAQELTGQSKVVASGSLQVTGSIFLQNQASAPTPGSAEAVLYARGGTLYFKNSSGSETAVGGGGGGVSDGDKGDITVSASGATWTIDNNAITTTKINNAAVTYAKIQNVSATDKLLGRSTAGAGSVEEITCTSAGRALLDDVDATAQRTTLGLGTLSTVSSIATANIDNDAVANSKLANMSDSTIKGRAAGAGTGDPTDLTATQATAILNEFTSVLKGLAPASGGGTTNFLRADGTWAAPAGGGGSGDVTGPASSTDNAIARFDGAGGKTIQDSAVTIADTTGNITTPGDIAVNGGDITTTASVFNIGTTATTGNQTLNLGTAVQTLNTKTVNLGTGGSGGVTNVNIGSSAGAGGTVTVNQDFKYSKALSASPIQVVTNSNVNLEAAARYVRMEGTGILTLPAIGAALDGRIVTITNARTAGAGNTVTVNVTGADAVYTTGGQVSWGAAGADNFKFNSGNWIELEAVYISGGTSIWYAVCGGIIPTLADPQ